MTRRLPLLLLGSLLLYLLYFYQLGSFAFFGADEPRYARIGEEMMLRSDWVTPTLNFQPWLEKPPLLFWLESISYRIFGVAEWTARLPVALLAVLAVLAVGLWGYETGGRRRALVSGVILATTPLFWIFGRFASTDMPLTAMMTLAMLFGFMATRRRSWTWGLGLGISLGLATLAKGPVAMILIATVFVLYFWLIQEYLWTRVQTLIAAASMLVVAIPWYWLVWKENGFDFVATFWLNHHLARFLTEIHHHTQPFWYYLPVLLIGFFPWSVFLASAGLRIWQYRPGLTQPRNRQLLLLWLWVLVPLIFFSLSQSKLAGYVLPVLPALALITGFEWDGYQEGDLTAYRMFRTEIAVFSAFSLLLLGILTFGFHLVYRSLPTGLVVALPLGLMLAAVRHWYHRRRPGPLFVSMAAGMSLFAALVFTQAGPLLQNYHSARELSVTARPQISEQQPLILYRYFHHTAKYYTGYQTTREAVSNVDELRRYMEQNPQSNYLALTQKAGWQDLQAAFSPELLRHEGNLFLVRLEPQPGDWTFSSAQDGVNAAE